MLAKILTQSLPGGIPIWQAIGIGLNAGLDPAMQSSHVVELEADQRFDPSSPPGMGGNNPFAKGGALNPKVQITERTPSSLAWSQQDTRAGLERARMIPHVAGSALSSAPQLSYQLYKPISDLGRSVVDPFRRAGVPRVTGLEGMPTLKELIADAMAGAMIAAEVIPPPMKPEATALGLAGGAIAKLFQKLGQFWGAENGPTVGPPAGEPGTSMSLNPATTYEVSWTTTTTSSPSTNPEGIVTSPGGTTTTRSPETGTFLITGADRIEYYKTSFTLQYVIGGTTSLQELPFAFRMIRTSDNTLLSTPGNTQEGTIGNPVVNASSVTETNYSVAVAGIPVTGGQSTAQPRNISVAPAPAPLILPLPKAPEPAVAPQLPTPEGLPNQVVPIGTTTIRLRNGQTVQTTRLPGYWPQLLNPGGTRAPQPNKIPSLTPVTPFGPVPLPNFPGADPARPTQQVDTAAQVVPLTPTRPATTAVGEITPWPGAAPIPAIGPAPRPTMEGIAEEVGKIERKLEIMMNPAAPGNLLDRFDDFGDLIRPLIEAFFSAQEGTTYGLDSPCEVDAEGNKLPPIEVEAQGALTQHGVLLNRLDALAELLQVHKNLKQPNCKTKPPTGEFVTVNFEQI